jgi:phosphoserine phosphatase
MSFVATLISGPRARALDNRALERAQHAVSTDTSPVWLAPGIAADIAFTAPDGNLRSHTEAIRAALGSAPIDVVVQPAAGRRKKLLLADMDSTMIGQECIDELADHLGIKKEVAAITQRAMRGEIEFEPAVRERVALLRGLPITAADEVIDNRIHITPGARTLVATMRRHGAYTCLVTGGFTLFTHRLAAMIGFDENRANRLLVDSNGRLTGEVAEPIFGREAKLATLLDLTQRLHLSREQSLVVGDGANDIAMIEAAALGIAYHAKPKVAAVAAARIDHGDLTALLYAQGYRREEFVLDDARSPDGAQREPGQI